MPFQDLIIDQKLQSLGEILKMIGALMRIVTLRSTIAQVQHVLTPRSLS